IKHEDTISITIQSEDVQGIIANKTEVMYNGLSIGQVKAITVNNDLKYISMQIDIDSKFKSWLTDKTEFWIVKPKIGLLKVSGLETLFSGNYIAIKPSIHGKLMNEFIAHQNPAILDNDDAIFYLTLQGLTSYSMSPESPIYFKKLKVGKVIKYILESESKKVILAIAIENQYKHLVRKNTKFWEVTGVQLEGDLTGFRIKSESLETLIKGGIAFDTPIWEDTESLANPEDVFVLYNNMQDAQLGIIVTVDFPLNSNVVDKDTPVTYRGLRVGVVHDVFISPDVEFFTAKLVIKPDALRLLVEGANFWIVRPGFNMQNMKDIPALLGGSYIALDIKHKDLEKAKPKKHFRGYDDLVYSSLNKPGLNLVLLSDTLNNITMNTLIVYKGLMIGSVTNIEFLKHIKTFIVSINIRKEYASLVNKSSQFFDQTSFKITGSLSNFSIQIPSLPELLSGSIQVDTLDFNADSLETGSQIDLQKYLCNKKDLQLSLLVDNLHFLRVGLSVLYRGVHVGRIIHYELGDPANKVILKILIDEKYANLVTKNSKFWNVSGIEVNGGFLSGLKVRTQSIETILSGGIVFATPNETDPPVDQNYTFILEKKVESAWENWNPKRSLKRTAN
ncbi:MAG: MCE family protein, partial [Endozoicomonadaceae bacterium]|nr:MCE family protein [Endozoicomonadaceae bacterium]